MKIFTLPNKKMFIDINWLLFIMTILIFFVGFVNMYSASSMRLEDGITHAPFYEKQLMWGGIGLCIMFGTMFINYKVLEHYADIFYYLVLILLMLVPIIGKTVYGAQRWLDLGFFSIQPSEFAKFSVLLMGAKFLSKDGETLGWVRLCKLMIIGIVPFALIVKQPDLGTGLTVVFLVAGMALFHGIKWKVLRICLVIIPLLLPLSWFVLHDYQQERIKTFLDPTRDPRGAGYHIIQSQIAIGSGQLLGKGFQEGTQSQLRFLPEKHTDFAVAVLGEEWGFVGSMGVVVIFCFFLFSIYSTISDARDRFGGTLCAGIFFYFFWQIVVNTGMVVGLMPVVGIPLPFISYGGTAMTVNCTFIGIVLSVSINRFVFKTQ